MKPLLNKIIRLARIRLLTVVAAGAALRNTTGLLILLVVAALLKRTLGLAIPGVWPLPVIFLFAVAAAVETFVRAPGRTAAALALDRAMVTRELFTTAIEMESVHGDIPDEIKVRAAAAARNCDVRTSVRFSVSPVLAIAPLVLAAVFLTISGQSAEPHPAQQINQGDPGGNAKQAIDKARTRLETVRAVTKAAAELEALGIPGLKDAVVRGDTKAASEIASKAAKDSGIDRAAIADIMNRLRKMAPDRGLRDRLAHSGVGDLGDLAGILAEYTAGADVSALVASLEALEAAAAAASVSGTGQPTGTGDEALPPDEIASGTSPIVDLDSVLPRYRALVKRYFTP